MTGMEHVVKELGLLLRSLKGLHQTVLAEAGLKVETPAAAVLATLEAHGQVRPSHVAELLSLDLSSVSRQVAALEREGWISRERDPADSRAALLELSDEGRTVLARLRRAQVEHLSRRLPGWTDAELEHFAASLQRFRDDLTHGPEADPPGTPHPSTHDQIPALAGRESS